MRKWMFACFIFQFIVILVNAQVTVADLGRRSEEQFIRQRKMVDQARQDIQERQVDHPKDRAKGSSDRSPIAETLHGSRRRGEQSNSAPEQAGQDSPTLSMRENLPNYGS